MSTIYTNLDTIKFINLRIDVPFVVGLMSNIYIYKMDIYHLYYMHVVYSPSSFSRVVVVVVVVVVVMVDIESRSDEIKVLDADGLLPLTLLVEWAC